MRIRLRSAEELIWQAVRGHDAQTEMFRRAIRRNRLSHAYLFHGPHGIGKRRFAQLLAQSLLCETSPDERLDACGTCGNCRKMLAGTHPDYLELACPKGKAVFPIELIAGDDKHRGRAGLCYDLSLRPSSGNRRIAVIDDAELFSQESANALLKTLEEPPDYCLIILLADDPDSLLPTIRSRCLPVRFAPLNNTDVADLLVQLGWVDSSEAAKELAAGCDGSLETAKQLLDPNIAAVRSAVLTALTQPDFHTTQVAEDITKAVQACGDTAAQRKVTGWVVRFGIDYYSRLLRNGDSTPQELERCGLAIERLTDATRQLEQNIQVPLVIHAMLDAVARLQRA